MDSDDETPTLSAETQRALQDFYANQNTGSDAQFVSENWQLSQFWYLEATSKTLAEEVLLACQDGEWVACLSCPSLYKSLLDLQARNPDPQKRLHIYLFEFDDRFLDMAKENFVKYDYTKPEDIPSELRGKFSFIAADPPFLANDCLGGIAITCSFLQANADKKLLLCTGEVMEEAAASLLGVVKTAFAPRHKSKLSNTFASFTNYEPVVLNKLGGANSEEKLDEQ
ncbi:putative Protein-lysine N-methyltransferase N6AMT2 [Hypsibius exemplaris]|uniref:Protein-lysine N-methyltransferase BV898_02855 n=1 Tax=Hypsibius exemplaris TaxID=2072580 RepID=A0A1W0X6D2_HYPEX|nr:putative Protein-lysine N-methyltransferase N6AMT2 [Hypsibius exemplaris]